LFSAARAAWSWKFSRA